MGLVIVVTLYTTFCAYLILPHLGAPPIFVRMMLGLCASEFVVAVGRVYSKSECSMDRCPSLAGTFDSAATLQIPLLTVAVVVVAGAYGVFVARRW